MALTQKCNITEFHLERWADWNKRKNNYGLSYPSESPIYRMMHIGCLSNENNTHHILTVPAEVDEIEQLVKLLWKENYKIADALRKFYLSDEKSMRKKAKALGVPVTQFKVHVDMAKYWLAGRLSARLK